MSYVNEDVVTLNKYYNEIRKTELLTPEQEVELAIRIQNGDEDAIHELATANLRFVVSIAREYMGNGISLSDLIGEGNYGLMKAARKFDHTRGFRFITYAVFWIRQSILQHLSDCARTIRLPVNILNKINKIKKEIKNYDIEPEITENETYEYLSKYPKCGSINHVINEDGDELLTILNDEPIKDFTQLWEEDSNEKEAINECLTILDNREREIVISYFGLNNNDPMTLEVIGEKYDLTKERVRQIKGKAIKKLRANIPAIVKMIN
jgi:RNA polymerase primary sigma factor